MCCDSWGRKESDTTEQLNWTEWKASYSLKILIYFEDYKFWFIIFKVFTPFLSAQIGVQVLQAGGAKNLQRHPGSEAPSASCSVAKCCPALCDPRDCSTPSFPVLHYLPSLLKFMSIESVMLSNHLIFCHPFSFCLQSFPTSESFPVSQIFTSGGQSTGVSALASFLPKKSQGWSPSEWTGWISLQSKGLSRVFSNTTFQKHQFFSAQLSL